MRTEGLTKRYRESWRGGTMHALRSCDLSLPAGKVAALVGANGAGKTTLLSILAGVLDPDEGTVHAPGRVAFVSQEKAAYRHLNPADMLRIGARLNRVWDAGRARNWLKQFQIPMDRACGKLSGGQQAQVAFAIALASCPSLLLLDEPLANLDPLVRREVMAELLSEVADSGTSVVLSTHIVPELGGVADHLFLLAYGQLVTSGDIDQMLVSHLHYVGPRAEQPPGPGEVVEARHRDGQSSFLVRLPEGTEPGRVSEPWVTRPVTLEDLVLAHLAANREETGE